MSASIRQLYPDRQWEYVSARIAARSTTAPSSASRTIYSRFSPQWRLEGGHRVDDAFRELLDQHWHEVDGAGFPWLYIPDAGSEPLLPGALHRADPLDHARDLRRPRLPLRGGRSRARVATGRLMATIKLSNEAASAKAEAIKDLLDGGHPADLHGGGAGERRCRGDRHAARGVRPGRRRPSARRPTA